ncbi:MarR family transcriptional regulator (plasmid) [Deinococcus metallilatus]|uniref:DNA-binding MarR family transcriptional regulator n=1 Tax=Deinococcus metallilatus TaxID=1211322 RepID=A0ABR6MWY0_9DEIO|nr:MarR family transcriptional regulator [Deinococcus metallilatus]MBB5295751.1 DNA-binding MarR family transcriptional regulator [Deinococcus metallilatus]QBY06807.1 MarR family transcriptional regulator [Deinococcus metallilatus]GMA14280.1 MarR family transcriptional regulator [Deinococcus metallilatus]
MTETVLDFESRLAHGDHQAIKVWLRLLTTTTLIEGEIRARLQERCGISLPRFDLLAQLERAPAGLRMGELSQRLMVTKGNVTGLADQLEREGLVERVNGPDRRSVVLRLTERGREAFAAMASVHEDWVIELLSALTPAEQEQLHALLGRLKGHLQTGGTA